MLVEARSAGATDVAGADAGVVVEPRVGGSRRPVVPQRRGEDDRELQALAHVRGEHLDGVGVGLQPSAALDGIAWLGAAPVQPRRECGQAEVLVEGSLVERLGDVSQVGEQAFAVRLGKQPLLQP